MGSFASKGKRGGGKDDESLVSAEEGRRAGHRVVELPRLAKERHVCTEKKLTKQIAVTAHQVRIQAQAPTEVPRNTLLDRSAQFELVSVTQAAPSGSRGGTVVVPRIHTVKPVKAIVTTKERNNDKWFSVQEHKKFAASFETNGHFLAAESGPVHEGGSCCVVM